MNPLASYQSLKNSYPRCRDVMAMAEHELSAFFKAVTQLFGTEQAELSAEDWLRELIEIDGLPASTREWRLITAKVSSRLATRVNPTSVSNEFTNA
jgi:alkylhydroperoxidase/carboxymuconolactone decarboxylase family protein YurZ